MDRFDWLLLGIEPTKDEDAIRRAYARQLKDHHPEEEPERWAMLHSAYQRALKYARGASYSGPLFPPEPQPERETEQGADALFAEAFEDALQHAETDEQDASAALPKRFPRVRREKDAAAFLDAIRALPLRTGGDETREAVKTAVQGLKPRRMTREAVETLTNGLWACAEELPQAAMRTCIETQAAELSGRLPSPEEIWKGDLRDARIVRVLSVFCGLLMLLSPTAEVLQIGSFIAFIGAIFGALTRRRTPRVRRERRANRTPCEKKSRRLLIAAIAVYLITGFALVPAAERLAPETVETPVKTVDYSPDLAENVFVSLTVRETPEYLCTTAPLTDPAPNHPQDPNGVVRTHYYLCRAEQAVLVAPDAQRAEAEALFSQCPFTVWGQIGPLPTDGGWCIRTPDGRALDVSVEDQLRNFNDLVRHVSDCGGCVVNYRSDEPIPPESHEVVSLAAQIVFGLLMVLNVDAQGLILLRFFRIWY